LVSDATGLLECIDMVRGNLTIGIDMEWSGTGVLSHPSGQAPVDLIQIGNSPSAMHCSVLDMMRLLWSFLLLFLVTNLMMLW
jgi:hypothetical protein